MAHQDGRAERRCRPLPDLDLPVDQHQPPGGHGELAFPDPGDDPVSRLVPVRATAALYGGLDDCYPDDAYPSLDLDRRLPDSGRYRRGQIRSATMKRLL